MFTKSQLETAVDTASKATKYFTGFIQDEKARDVANELVDLQVSATKKVLETSADYFSQLGDILTTQKGSK